ncbi:MAG: transglycosylase SLT domain-containing protein [Bacteroidales bacterium]|jgi:membrane-bound lytic murein transglycosylase D|nr:transglycosylase SLT domain-containing protein [Bacteroidales bacterium]
MKYTFLFLIFFSFFEGSILAQETFKTQQTEVDTSIIEQLDALMSTWYARKMDYHENSQSPVVSQDLDYSTVDSVMIHRLKVLTDKTVFPMVFNEDIRAYINMYIKRKQSVSVMLGLAKYYFPFFEETLDKYNCPLELRYLAVIESALNPTAVSRAGATGLWQFMYNTGKMYGLEVTTMVDYRCDPYKSTDAAARHLKDLSEMFFNDWVLAIAAYNCGAGNVKKAIVRSGGKTNFWEIYNYLPRETRGYIPAFYGAWYVMQYYDKYGIEPAEMKFGQVDTFLITDKLHLQQISSVINIPMDEIKSLNPQYKRNIIPPSNDPMHLILPVEYSIAFELMKDSIYKYNTDQFFPQPAIFIDERTQITSAGNTNYKLQPKTHVIKSGESLSTIARKYRTTVSELTKMNKIRANTTIHPGKKLIVGYNKISLPKPKPTFVDSVKLALDTTKILSDTIYKVHTDKGQQETEMVDKNDNPSKISYITYKVVAGDTLTSIISQFKTVSVSELLKINQLKEGDVLNVGQSLKIPVQ